MIYLELFWSFVKIGFTSFGGLSMIPLINHEMVSHGWMTLEEVADIVAIAEMTPGPLGLNCATFAGMQVAGLPGSLVTVFGVLSPTLTVCLAAHCEIHAHFGAFAHEVVVEVLNHLLVATFGNADFVLCYERERTLFAEFLELRSGNAAHGAFFGSFGTFVDVTANGADEFLFHFE